MKKILIFSVTYHPFVGGAEIAVKEITDRIKDVRFDMITLRLDKDLPRFEKIGNVYVHRIGFASRATSVRRLIKFPYSLNKYFFPFTACFYALRLHRKYKYDAFWSIMANYAGFAALFMSYLRPKTPYILTLQEGDPIDHIRRRVRFFHPFFRRIFWRARIIQPISNYLSRFARSMGYEGRIEVVPNGVDVARFSENFPPYEMKKIRSQYEVLSPSSPNNRNNPVHQNVFLVTTSRLVAKNSVEDTISALEFLPDYVSLLIIGDGPKMNDLLDLASNEKHSERVHFLGFIGHNDLPKYLKLSDIFIRPSLSEGFGNSFVEAMASGIPVIGTPVGGIVDFLFDPDRNPSYPPTGLFCQVRNPKSIASQVMRLIEDRELCKKLTTNALEMVQEKYDWNIIADEMREKVFRKVIEN